METQIQVPSGFVRRCLPWVVAAAALTLYVATLTPWVRSDSLGTLGSVEGWGLYLPVQAPLLHLLTRPVRWLPGGMQTWVLNGVTALMAALVLALLARSVALLPFDRTPASRVREPGPHALLNHRLAWLPVALACALCGLQLTFWEHATALTGEMLDLLVFAYAIRCLLEYRVDRRDRWLLKFALACGAGVTNNYALVVFLPGFLAAVAALKSWECLRLRFWGSMLGAGVAGLLFYLYLPLAGMHDGEVLGTFAQHLKAELGAQWASLRALPPWVALMLSFTSVLPALVLSLRWTRSVADAGSGAQALVGLVLKVLQAAVVVGCFSVFYDPPWGARILGRGLAFLPLYYLSALSVGYCAGYYLVMTRPSAAKGWPLPPGLIERLGPVATGLALTVLVVAPGVLAVRNWTPLRIANTAPLGRLADQMTAGLPREGAYVFGDLADDLLLAEARVRHTLGRSPHVFAYTRWIESPEYQARLGRRNGARWPVAPELAKRRQALGDRVVTEQLIVLARSNAVFFLNPSFGAYFEALRLRPEGLLWRVQVLPPDPPLPAPWTERDLGPARQFWDQAAGVVGEFGREVRRGRAGRYPELVYSRALNHWGVTLQRLGDAAGAGRWFELAWRLNTNSVVAQVNRAFNLELQKSGLPQGRAEPALAPPAELPVWETQRLLNGPVDQPRWTLAAAQAFAQAGHYRQALIEFDRARTLFPSNSVVAVWRDAMAAMTRLRFGDVAGAERAVLDLQAAHPGDEVVCESLTQVYLVSGRPTNALASIDRQLQLNPTNANTLLNKAALHIQLGAFAPAIAAADKVLALQPKNAAARLNRAIAQLQSGRLDAARADYTEALRALPLSPDVHFGLGEVARQKKDTATALEHFRKYLECAQPGSAEYQAVAKRVEELGGGGSPR